MLSAKTGELLVFLIAFAAMIVAGAAAARRIRGRGVAEYFLAGRSAGWVVVGGSLFATTMWTLLVCWLAMPSDWRPGVWIVMGAIIAAMLFLSAAAFLPLYRSTGKLTIPGILADRYGPGVGLTASGGMILLALLVRIPLAVVVGSRLVSLTMGREPIMAALFIVVVPGLLAVVGGYSVVLSTQAVQACVAFIGLCVLAVQGTSSEGFMLQGVLGTGDSSWVLLVGGILVVALWGAIADQFTVQRMLAARSDPDAKRGAAVAGLLTVVGIALVASGGSMPLPRFAPGMNDPGVTSGIVGAAIIFFVMANLSGQFLSVSTLFTMDVFRSMTRGKDEASLVLVGRLATTTAVILTILMASWGEGFDPGVLGWLLQAVVVLIPPLASVTVIGVHWRKMHGRGALWALGSGWAAGAIGFASGLVDGSSVTAMMMVALLSFMISTFVLIGVSLLVTPSAAEAGAMGSIPSRILGVRKP